MNYLLEIAAFTLQGACSAQDAGAHRIELCENPADGGTTPSYGMLKTIQQLIHIPVFPIIRPRGGDFFYSEMEKKVILEDIALCRSLGFPGIVCGALQKDGRVDVDFMTQVMDAAGSMELTFHRAFDRCLNPEEALEELIKLGCRRILSSGQYPSVMDGLPRLCSLISQANGRLIIMPGSGLHSGNVADIAQRSGAREFHTAARTSFSDASVFAAPTMQEKASYITVDTLEIQRILAELNRLP